MNCNENISCVSQKDLLLFKELLSYCGNGKFPLIENSVCSSYLATVVYLDEIDDKLYDFIQQNKSSITKFKMIRYVDDLYILFSSDKDILELNETYFAIRNKYSSMLKSLGLSLNERKCCLKESHRISEELKKSLYDEFYIGEKHRIPELFPNAINDFLEDVYTTINTNYISTEIYNKLIEKHFSNDEIEFAAGEVFNYYVYDDKSNIDYMPIVKTLNRILTKSLAFFSLDSKRLMTIIMKTKNEKLIKHMLYRLFKKHRKNEWTNYDTNIAIQYLLQSGFKHIDLLDVISKEEPLLYEYYYSFCKHSFLFYFKHTKYNQIIDIILDEEKTYVLYFLYYIEEKRKNNLNAFAYFKSYFDRLTAILMFKSGREEEKFIKPNYGGYYKEGAFHKAYACINNQNEIIRKAFNLRNNNPVAHSSVKLLYSEDSKKDIYDSIENLKYLVNEFISKYF